LAVILSLVISLFWLLVVVAVHAALEWYVHWREHPSVVHTGARVAWEIKLDLALVLFALALAVYMDYIMGAAGLSAAARAGARGVQATGRMIAWQRGLRAVLLTLDDAAQVTRAAISSGQKAAAAAPAPEPPKRGWDRAVVDRRLYLDRDRRNLHRGVGACAFNDGARARGGPRQARHRAPPLALAIDFIRTFRKLGDSARRASPA
jgi:hypothetical protein